MIDRENLDKIVKQEMIEGEGGLVINSVKEEPVLEPEPEDLLDYGGIPDTALETGEAVGDAEDAAENVENAENC